MLNQDNVINAIVSKLYYDEFGQIKDGKIESVLLHKNEITVTLRDNQTIKITVEVNK